MYAHLYCSFANTTRTKKSIALIDRLKLEWTFQYVFTNFLVDYQNEG